MEIPVVVEVAGTITELAIEAGGTVREGDLMAVIEPGQ